jgi:hypothetical protein
MATLMLSRTLTRVFGANQVSMVGAGMLKKPLQVEVKTDPSSPAVGVNVEAVDQTVTFARGQNQVAVRIPILAGAPNPGELDVTLTATPIGTPTGDTGSASLVLRILAPDEYLPPRIIGEQGTPQGIVLAFNKPMDPAAASNVHNYDVKTTFASWTENGFLGFIDAVTFPLHFDSSLFPTRDTTLRVPLRAAEYDPATSSVTLVPKHRLTYRAEISVTQGSGTTKSSLPGNPPDTSGGLIDAQGLPINADFSPGQFWVNDIEPGNQL